MDYSHYSVTQFADDPTFRDWVNRADEDSVVFWENWLRQNPVKSGEIRQAAQLVRLLDSYQRPALPKSGVAGEVAKFRQAIQTVAAPQPSTQPSPYKVRSLGTWAAWQRMAAVLIGLLVLAGAGFWFNYYHRHPIRLVETPLGGFQQIQLPDGSSVTLNANSRLKYAPDWSDHTSREVWLEGDAYFNVVKKRHSPGQQKFIVHTHNLEVEVLGTQFTVHHRRGATQVVLDEGKVQLRSNQLQLAKPVVMQPGDFVRLSQQDTTFTRKRVNPETYSGWRRNKLIFVSAPLGEVARLLEDHYGWKVIFQDSSLSNEKFTATIRGRNPNVLLRVLAESFGLKVIRQGKQIFLARK